MKKGDTSAPSLILTAHAQCREREKRERRENVTLRLFYSSLTAHVQ